MTTVRRRLIPYFLMGPGLIWLILFFVIPIAYMAELSLRTGSLETGFQLTWAWQNFSDSITPA